MAKIVYYVASSIDGFICGTDGDISLFAQSGSGVDQYLQDLNDFKTVIMGRKTYEFGYAYGLQPGQPAYPHMEHFIFSKTLQFENASPNVHIKALSVEAINEIKSQANGEIYLCGGGQLAAFLLQHQLIDIVKIKLNPILLGEGVKLFGDNASKQHWDLIDSQTYEGGLQFLTYSLKKN